MSTEVTTEKIRRLYVAWSDRGEDRRAKEFDAWLAAHDQALREQIEQDIVAHARARRAFGLGHAGDAAEFAYATAAHIARRRGRSECLPTMDSHLR